MKHPPTVLHVLEAFAGGTERHLLDLVRHVRGFGHVIAVPSEHQGRSTAPAMRRAQEAGARVCRVEMGRAAGAALNLPAVIRLRAIIQELGPDVVHGHSSIGGALARVAARGRPVPVVYTPNGLSRARWATAVERMLGSRIDRFIAVSASERDFAVRHAVVAPERIVVIPNGIELTPPEPPGRSLRDHLGLAADVPLVGSCARLTWQKAPEVYVAAAAIVARTQPAAHFVLIGDGPMRGSIEEAIEQAELSGRFHLLPGLDRADAALAELDVYALPSRFEGGPYTPLEAMRAGTPVIVTDAAGNRDTVRHNTTGLVVPRDDPAGLAAAIAAVLEDRVLRERLIAGARAALPAFDVERMAAATEEVYSELVARRRLVAALRRRSAHGDRRGDRMDRRAVAAHTYPAARDRRTGHPDRRTGHPDRRTAHRQSRPARVRS